jgi:hypothetical protein
MTSGSWSCQTRLVRNPKDGTKCQTSATDRHRTRTPELLPPRGASDSLAALPMEGERGQKTIVSGAGSTCFRPMIERAMLSAAAMGRDAVGLSDVRGAIDRA